jgi:hypothetical protein
MGTVGTWGFVPRVGLLSGPKLRPSPNVLGTALGLPRCGKAEACSFDPGLTLKLGAGSTRRI